MREAVCSSKTIVGFYRITWSNILEDTLLTAMGMIDTYLLGGVAV
jgi:hypothetical protein